MRVPPLPFFHALQNSINRHQQIPSRGLKALLTPLSLLFPSSSSRTSCFSHLSLNPRNEQAMVGDITAVKTTVKFLCSYGGKILPRYPDGKLRYVGGFTRVLAVDRSISFTELVLKLGELCGSTVSLRCQLPSEDLDALISITSDEDLANLIEEYDRASQAASSSLKIRAFLSLPKSIKQISPPLSTTSSPTGRYSRSDATATATATAAAVATLLPGKAAYNHHCVCHLHHQISKPPVRFLEKSAGCYAGNSPRQMYLVHNGNHWQ